MKAEIHPKLHQTQVKCACGAEFILPSTRAEISLDICSACHPFFTGKAKFVDTAGRVDKFFKKYGEDVKAQKRTRALKRVAAPVEAPEEDVDAED